MSLLPLNEPLTEPYTEPWVPLSPWTRSKADEAVYNTPRTDYSDGDVDWHDDSAIALESAQSPAPKWLNGLERIRIEPPKSSTSSYFASRDVVNIFPVHRFTSASVDHVAARPTKEISRPPSAEDWDRNWELITTLYVKDNRTLREVMQVMEKDHGFSATSAPLSIF